MLKHRQGGPFTIEPVVIGSVTAYYLVVNAAGVPVAQGSLSLCRRTLGLPDLDTAPQSPSPPQSPPTPAREPPPPPRQASLF
ncbi:hypothetical protein V5F40_22960 [Xanthobacter sp. DSM 14520]|uniref:hypothetical protein n=1 Tax=Xanthobacter autotrophicus (strain ATCC BAA-1158 / Py2) TaxID=78245 RepID=UPI00372C331B